MGDSCLASLSMENHHPPSTLLSMDSSASSHEELDLEMNRQIILSRPPDINLPLSAERSPPPQSWNSEPCDILDVGLGTQGYETETFLNVPKAGRKCAKRVDSIWGAWFFFSFYFKPSLNDKSKAKIVASLCFLIRMMRPHDDDVVAVERKRKVVRTTAKRPKLVQCPTTRTSPPSQPPPILPDELILEILLRLPVRSLVQFRSVCNSWRTLISSPQFAKYHLQRSIGDPTLTHPRCVYFSLSSSSHKMGIFSIQALLENPSDRTKVVSFGRGRHGRVLGSCNGLLYLYELDYAYKDSRAILWNPCTRLTCEWLEIGQTGSVMSAHGFGYDHVHDNYKLFVLLKLLSGGSVAKIFTFGANYWRTIQDFPFNVVDPIGVFVSGTLHWLYFPEEEGPDWMLASLDVGKETYGQLSLPERDADDDLWFTLALGVLRNCLAVGLDHKKTHWGVWVMKEYGVQQSWTKLVMIPHGPLDCKHSFFFFTAPLHLGK